MTDEEIAEYVDKSRAAQGLPRHIEDPVALAEIAALFALQQESKQWSDELREQRKWASESFKRRRTKR